MKEVIKACIYPFQKHPNSNNTIGMTKAQYERYVKFTVVSNPWARAYSWYRNVMRDEIHQKTLGVGTEITFKDFLGRFRGHGILKPQTHWLKDFDHRIPMDYICRFENLQSDFDEVCKLMAIERIQLPHTLKGSGEDYAAFYDADSIRMIEETYADDIRLFGYSFDDGT